MTSITSRAVAPAVGGVRVREQEYRGWGQPTRGIHTADGSPAPTPRFRGHHSRQPVLADLVEFCCWVSVAAAVAVYLSVHAGDPWSGTAVFTHLGMIAGVVATDLLVVQLMLAARIPLVDRGMGQDRALDLHRRITVWTMTAVAVHVIALTVVWSLDSNGLWRAVVALWNSPDIPWAVVSVLGFLLVALTSWVVVRRHLPHEVWHVIHLLTYAAVAAAVPHMFTSSQLFTSGWQRTYWILLLSLAAACLVGFRIVLPVAMSLEHRLVVRSVRHLTPDLVEVTLDGRRLESLGARAGQYMTWRFLAPGLWWHEHPLSLSAAPDGTSLRITFRVAGDGTARLARDLRPGTRAYFEGPYGRFTVQARNGHGLVLVGCGVGITPVRALLENIDIDDEPAVLIARGRTHADLVHLDEIAELCRARNVRLIILVGRRDRAGGWTPEGVRVRLDEIAPWVRESDLYVCGPAGWTAALEAEAKDLGVRNIHDERFSW